MYNQLNFSIMKYDIIYFGGYGCCLIDSTDSFEEAKSIAKEHDGGKSCIVSIHNNSNGVIMDSEGNLMY